MQESNEGKDQMMSLTASYVQLYRILNDLPAIGEALKKKEKR